jgi:hypothetical protein
MVKADRLSSFLPCPCRKLRLGYIGDAPTQDWHGERLTDDLHRAGDRRKLDEKRLLLQFFDLTGTTSPSVLEG